LRDAEETVLGSKPGTRATGHLFGGRCPHPTSTATPIVAPTTTLQLILLLTHNPEIVLGVLIEVFGLYAVATRSGVARHGLYWCAEIPCAVLKARTPHPSVGLLAVDLSNLMGAFNWLLGCWKYNSA